MKEYSIEQLGLFITLMIGSCGGLLAICFKSRCDEITTPCLKIHRKVPDKPELEPDENI